jgi:hypothetical protein
MVRLLMQLQRGDAVDRMQRNKTMNYAVLSSDNHDRTEILLLLYSVVHANVDVGLSVYRH